MREIGTQLIPDEWVDQAVIRWKNLNQEDLKGRVFIGIDTSFYHKENTILKMIDGVVTEIIQADFASDKQVTEWILSHIPKDRPYFIAIDVTAHGKAIYSELKNRDIKCSDVHFSSRYNMDEDEKYLNFRTFAWFLLKKFLDPQNSRTIAIPEDQKLIEELKIVQWYKDKNQYIRLQNTEDIYKALQRTLSLSKALVLAVIILDSFTKDKK